jgi:hypothetical protein
MNTFETMLVFTFNHPHDHYLNYKINSYFMSEMCPRCGQDKGIKITYFNKMDGTGLHLICTDYLDSFLKKQPYSME